MILRTLTVLLLLLSIGGRATAQTDKIASLLLREKETEAPKKRLSLRLQLLEAHESLYKDSLLPLAKRTFDLASNEKDIKAEGYANLGIINALLRLDNANAADSLIRAVLPAYPINNTDLSDINLRLRLAATSLLAAKAEYEEAVKQLLTIATDAEKKKNYAILSRSLNELGVISYNRNDLPAAIGYYNRALSYESLNPQAEQTRAYAYINLAQVYGWMEQYDTALRYIDQARPICLRLQNLYYLANAYAVEASIYKWSGDMAKAENAMLRMVALREKTEGNLTFSNEQLGLANFYVYARDYEKAIATYRAGLDYHESRVAKGLPPGYELLLYYYEGLAKAYSAVGRRDEYEASLRQIISLKDTISARSSAAAITEMQTKYEVQKKENTIIAQKLDITRKTVLFYGSLLVLAMTALIGWLLFSAYRRRSRAALQEEKLRASLAIREAEETERKRIAADLHDSLGSYAASIKSNADELKRNQNGPLPALDLLQNNAQQMVSLLSDTIWAMRKDQLRLSDISDRTKVLLQRLRPNYPDFTLRVTESLDVDNELPPANGYHLFMIIQEGVNNALKHSGGNLVTISITGGNTWKVCIRDNGKGIGTRETVSEGGNGMHTMQQRASNMNCTIAWQTLHGTELCLQPTSN